MELRVEVGGFRGIAHGGEEELAQSAENGGKRGDGKGVDEGQQNLEKDQGGADGQPKPPEESGHEGDRTGHDEGPQELIDDRGHAEAPGVELSPKPGDEDDRRRPDMGPKDDRHARGWGDQTGARDGYGDRDHGGVVLDQGGEQKRDEPDQQKILAAPQNEVADIGIFDDRNDPGLDGEHPQKDEGDPLEDAPVIADLGFARKTNQQQADEQQERPGLDDVAADQEDNQPSP